MYEDKGVELVVKIWEKADGTIEKLSDAWAQKQSGDGSNVIKPGMKPPKKVEIMQKNT